nr:MAG TPA: hypothetical protein [Caudoviricetes sp.]
MKILYKNFCDAGSPRLSKTSDCILCKILTDSIHLSVIQI